MNYNTLRNKPTINYREIIGDSTVSEVGGITEDQFDQLLDTDLASYYTKAQIDELFARSFIYKEKSGSIVTFDCPTNTNGIAEVTSEIVAVQSGTGDPSPTNIRPLIGFSAVNRYRSGKNLCNFADKTITEGTYVINNAPVCLPAGSYVLSFDFTGTTSSSSFRIDDKNGNSIFSVNKVVSEGTNTVSITLSQTGFYVKYYSNAVGEYSNFQIEQGTQPTTYEAFSGTTYTTTLKDSQGNPLVCYGGELSNVNGVQTLTLTHGYISSYNGETLPSTWISDRDVYAEGTTPTTGAEVVYALATSQQITQDTLSITSIAGINNIWCDSGDITVKALDRIIQG